MSKKKVKGLPSWMRCPDCGGYNSYHRVSNNTHRCRVCGCVFIKNSHNKTTQKVRGKNF